MATFYVTTLDSVPSSATIEADSHEEAIQTYACHQAQIDRTGSYRAITRDFRGDGVAWAVDGRTAVCARTWADHVGRAR